MSIQKKRKKTSLRRNSNSKKNFFHKNYSKCFDYFKEFKNQFIASLIIFCLFFIIGFAYPVFFRPEIISFIKELETLIKGKTAVELINFIFLNNLQASAFAMVLGIFFGIFPIMVAIANGYILGFVSHEAVAVKGILVMWRLIPHGIFELPAIIFSIALGMKIGSSFFHDEKIMRLKHNVKESIRFFVFIVIPLLIIAGIIEGILVASGV